MEKHASSEHIHLSLFVTEDVITREFAWDFRAFRRNREIRVSRFERAIFAPPRPPNVFIEATASIYQGERARFWSAHFRAVYFVFVRVPDTFVITYAIFRRATLCGLNARVKS